MADEITIASAEFREKNRLENLFRTEVRKFQRKIVKITGQLLTQNGTVITKDSLFRGWEKLLLENYQRVAGSFEGNINDLLEPEEQLTEEEKEQFHIDLMIFFSAMALAQADIIATTDVRQAGSAFATANLSSQEAEIPFTSELIIGTTIGLFSANLAARTNAIASIETQVPAEITKNSEVRALIGDAASNIVNKIWITRRDERVRPAHVEAHSQKRLSNKPFDVGGEQLMFPGDMSLGASIENIANCRCSSIVDTNDIGEIRRRQLILVQSGAFDLSKTRF